MKTTQKLRFFVRRLTGGTKYHYLRPLLRRNRHKQDWSTSPVSSSRINKTIPAWLPKLCERVRQNDKTLLEINLAGRAIRTLGAMLLGDALEYNTHVLIINLDYNDIEGEGFVRLFQGLAVHAEVSQLEELHIRGNHMSSVTAALELSRVLRKLTTLREFHLSDNPLNDEGVCSIAAQLRHASLLQVLSFRNTRLTDDGLEVLAFNLPSGLRELDVSDNFIESKGATLLCSKLCTLQRPLLNLHISHNRLDDHGARAIATLIRASKSLSTLDLSFNNIGARGADALFEGIGHSVSLTYFNLSDNHIQAAGCRRGREGLAKNTSLKTLLLQSNDIGDEGVLSLSDGLRDNVSLESLHLCQNDITQAGAKHLATALRYNRTLEELVLEHNPVEQQGVEAILETLRSNKTLMKVQVSCADMNLRKELDLNLQRNFRERRRASQGIQEGHESLALVPYHPQDRNLLPVPVRCAVYI